jgi:hypothetical protein
MFINCTPQREFAKVLHQGVRSREGPKMFLKISQENSSGGEVA